MNLPSREECEGWDPAQVAFFLCKIKMSECAVTVNRLRINGQRLLNLSDSDMSKFSLIHQPQLQKIVQDIKKSDGSFLNKLKRIKNKQRPNLPPRDYRDNMEGDEQLSDDEYDNDMYEDPRDDASYEPPPTHRVFNTAPSTSFPREEYLDSCRNRPSRPPRRPPRTGQASRQLPPEPTQDDSDEDDYINPDPNNDDDNYVEPAENPPANPLLLSRSRAERGRPMLSPHLEGSRQPSPDFYEVPEGKEQSGTPPVSRPCQMPLSQSASLPPKPSPRVTMTRSPTTVPDTTGDDEYEVCDPDKGSGDEPAEAPPLRSPKPLPRERSPKPPPGPRPELKPREFESRSLLVVQTDQRLPPKPFTLDLKRPKIPLPQLTSPKPAERGSFSADGGSTDQDKDSDLFRKPWYASACDRKTADDVLLHFNKDGGFMVRKSSGQDAQQPYTLVVFYRDRVYNIPIRFIPSTHQYALGREKKGEEHFSSICHIIENHQRNPLVLIDSQSNSKDATKLCFPVKP